MQHRDRLERPRYVLESHEDQVYHDQEVGDRSTDPEYYAFLGRSWVFNRAMRWLDGPGETLICYSEAGDLVLSGEENVSAWFSDPVNEISHSGERTRFIVRSDRHRDCIVLPALQFEIERYPTAYLKVAEAKADWQLCVFVKGRSGPPVLASPWRQGSTAVEIDLQTALQKSGFNLHFVELFFVVGLWSASSEAQKMIDFSLRLNAAPAMVPCLPIVRACAGAHAEVLPVSAMVLDGRGERVGPDRVSVTAELGDRVWQLSEQDGTWWAQLSDVPQGEHSARLSTHGDVRVSTTLSIRVTDGEFIGYDPRRNLLTRGGRPVGPQSGSYQGLVYVRDAGTPDERLVQGQADYDAWDRIVPPGEHWHYWEGLTEAELEARFTYLERNGWDLLHLCQHWGLWEKLDAGGRIAPHGAEQVALYYRVAARHGLATVQALSHYPYGTDALPTTGRHRTPVYRQYLEAGYQESDWQDVSSEFTQRFHAYLDDYTRLFRDETAVALLTTSGEGDYRAGPERVNDTCRHVRACDRNHLFASEPIFRIDDLPSRYCAGWDQPLFGSRLYWIGHSIEPELDLAVEFKLMGLGPVYMAEGSWPCPPLYAALHNEPRTWAGAEEYRTRVRDSLYLGLVHRVPVLLTWEEQLTEDERIVLRAVRERVNWAQRFRTAPVAIRVSDKQVREERHRLRELEAAFSSWPLASRYLANDEPAPVETQIVLDAREPIPDLSSLSRPAFAADGGPVPDTVKQMMPLRISPDYRASYCWSDDQRTMLAYIYNCAGHLDCDYHGLAGRYHRIPRPAQLDVSLHHFPQEQLIVQVYDIAAKALVREDRFAGAWSLDLGSTSADLLVLVAPE
ncbi:MAG: hypothetical protein GX620_04485 [Chloroflexi bacterium]|nr:hypothetical protein [Chloroflexota bacterium]